VPAQRSGAEIVAEVRRFLGRPYIFGADGPNAFDCSGLVYYACHQLGINTCPRTSEEQFGWVKRVDTPSPGDLVFFVGSEQDPPPGHVGIVISPGWMIDAPHTGTVVQVGRYSTGGTGVSKFMGFGAIPDTTVSPTANGSLIRPGTKEVQTNTMTAIGGSIVGSVLMVGFALLVIAAIAIGMRFT
jgi:hypothetical protein